MGAAHLAADVVARGRALEKRAADIILPAFDSINYKGGRKKSLTTTMREGMREVKEEGWVVYRRGKWTDWPDMEMGEIVDGYVEGARVEEN